MHGVAARDRWAVTEAAVVTAHSKRARRARPAVPVGAGVEQHDGPALGRPVLLADHQVAGAGRRRPVDAAQVVAVAVLADGLVVLTVERDHVRDLALGADAVAERPAAEQRHGPGQHDDLGGPLDRRRAQLVRPNGSRTRTRSGPSRARPRGGSAPAYCTSAALRAAGPAEHEPGPVTERVVEPLLGQQQRRGRRARCCATGTVTRPTLVDGDPARGGRRATTSRCRRGGARARSEMTGEDEQQDADPGDVGKAEQHAGGDEDDAAPGEGALPGWSGRPRSERIGRLSASGAGTGRAAAGRRRRRRWCGGPAASRRWGSAGGPAPGRPAAGRRRAGRGRGRRARRAPGRRAAGAASARGEAPSRRAGLERVAVTRSTTYCRTAVGHVHAAHGVDERHDGRGVGDRLEVAPAGEPPPWLSSIVSSARGDG